MPLIYAERDYGSIPATSITLGLTGPAWDPDGPPAPGDLVVMAVFLPAGGEVTPPAGWIASDDGRQCWKVWGPHEPEFAVFHAATPGNWWVRAFVARAGTYKLPGSQS